MTKTIKKRLLIASVLLSVAIIFSVIQYIRYYRIPDKRAVNMELEEVEDVVPLDSNIKQIYVFRDSELGMLVLGADKKLFKVKNINERERVYIIGNAPETLDSSLSGNTFILNGEYIGKRKASNQGVEVKTFKVDSWDIYNTIDRDGSENNKSTDYLTKSDYSGSFPMKIPEKDLYDAD